MLECYLRKPYSLSQIASTVRIDNTVPLSALGTQLINLFPILLVSSIKHDVLINCHELIMCGDSFEKLLLLDQKQKAPAINISSISSKVDGQRCYSRQFQ